jgi:MarR family transcriptional regulator for hemolysin
MIRPMSTSPDRIRNFGYLIKDIGRLYTKRFEEEADHLGITLSEAKVLTYISRNSGLSQIQLAELTGVEPMSLVRILDRMEADHWIERRAHPTDRRARQLYLKTKAQSMVDQIAKLSTQVQAQSLVGFKADERSALVDLLQRVHQRLLHMVSEKNGKHSSQRTTPARTEPRTTRKRIDPSGIRVPARATSSRTLKTRRAAR